MAFQLTRPILEINNYSGDMKPTIIADYECDAQSDLPVQSQSNYYIGIGSRAHVIEDNSEWCMRSNGNWVMQESGTAAYTKAEVDALLSVKANKATTLSGYGITNAYTKTQTDNLLNAKANSSDVYTKTQTDNLLLPKITLTDVFGIPSGSFIPEEDGINLNSYATQGIYIKQFSAHVSTFDNTPFDGSTDFPYTAFKLIVEYINSSNNILQTLIPLTDDCKFYKRVRMTGSSGIWRSWKYFTGITV